jgi:CBS domain-containing protein
MESDSQEMLIKGFSDNELKEVLDELYLDDAVDIVEEMPANVVKRIISNTDDTTRKMINEILKYPEDSAGSIMTIEYVSLRPNQTAEEAIKRIRRTGIDKETIYTCYVTDDNRVLIGALSIKDLLLADEDAIVKDLMDTNLVFAHTLEDQEAVANKFNKYDLLATLKDVSIERAGEVDPGSQDLELTFSIVGETNEDYLAYPYIPKENKSEVTEEGEEDSLELFKKQEDDLFIKNNKSNNTVSTQTIESQGSKKKKKG